MEAEKRREKIKTIKASGYTEAELSKLKKDGYALEIVSIILKSGYTKTRMEEDGVIGIIQRHMKETGFSLAEIEAMRKERVIRDGLIPFSFF